MTPFMTSAERRMKLDMGHIHFLMRTILDEFEKNDCFVKIILVTKK